MPVITARSGAFGVVSTFDVIRLPPWLRAKSVKVPPMSTVSRTCDG